jgi:amino-acid N-acetyltransferase
LFPPNVNPKSLRRARSNPKRYAFWVTNASQSSWSVRRAKTSDIAAIAELVQPLVEHGILLGKDLVVLFESVQEFMVAVDDKERVIGCGALHVFWEDLGEVRTLAVVPERQKQGIGHGLLDALEEEARRLGLSRLFCLTFEVDFFSQHGFELENAPSVDPEVFSELLRSPDEGVAEFLDLARVKPNTLGNSRMVKNISV